MRFIRGFDRYRPGERTPKLELRRLGSPGDSRIVGRVRLLALRVRVRLEPRGADPSHAVIAGYARDANNARKLRADN